jgi:hypothetical protein
MVKYRGMIGCYDTTANHGLRKQNYKKILGWFEQEI